jgi:predicted porin
MQLGKRNLGITFTLGLFFLLAAPDSRAELKIHGFGDLVTSKSNSDLGVNTIGNRGRALDLDSESRMGLNISSELTDNLTFAGQVVARGAGGGSYNLQADWLFLTYQLNERFALRAGRQIIPAFLFSEQTDVGFTYVWTRLPYDVYGILPIKSINGLSAIHKTFMGDALLTTQLFAGGGDLALASLSRVPDGAPNTVSVVANNMYGLALTFTQGGFKAHAHYSTSNHTKVYLSSSTAANDLRLVQVATLGAMYDSGRWLVIAEGIRHHSSDPAALLGSMTSSYLTLGYHLGPKWTPYVSGGWRHEVSSTLLGYPGYLVQTPQSYMTGAYSYVAGFNYRASLSTMLKGEFMRSGFRFVDNALNYRTNTFTGTVDFVF